MTEEEKQQFEAWAIQQLKETIEMSYKHIDVDKSFALELKIKYSKKKDKTDVTQGFYNSSRG